MILLIPMYDRLLVRLTRKFTGLPTGITHFQRIGVELTLSGISMAVGALVEVKRKDVAKNHGMLDAIPLLQPLPISIFWLTAQYFVFGIANILTWVGLIDFFYSESPKAMKSMATCFFWCSMALGYFLSSALVHLVDELLRGEHKERRMVSWE